MATGTKDHESPSSSTAFAVFSPSTPTPRGSRKSASQPPASSSPPLVASVTIRYLHVLPLAAVAVVFIVAVMVVFLQGLELERFSASRSEARQNKLVDDYNSYSGIIASVFGKPLELFVSQSTQLIVLCVMARAIVRPSGMDWRIAMAALGFSAGMGYLISNGFNALNVQLRPLPVQPVLSAADLSSAFAYPELLEQSTSLEATVTEEAPGNVVTNTILRNLLMPPAPRPATYCDWNHAEDNSYGDVPDTVVSYGVSSREWQIQMLRTAPATKFVRLPVNASRPSTSQTPSNAASLPMNASLAADLFIYAMYTAPAVFPIGFRGDFVNKTNASIPWASTDKPWFTVPSAVAFGLLPADETAPESVQREWLARESGNALLRQLVNAQNFSRSDLAIEFSSVQISPFITFDSITIEIDIDPDQLTTHTSADNQTRYTQLRQEFACGPWLSRCMIPKPRRYGTRYDPSPQIHVFGISADTDGSERLLSNVTGGEVRQLTNFEWAASNSSFLVVSLAKKLTADSIQYNTSVGTAGELLSDPLNAVVTNVRTTYSFTVGRLHWQLQDLSTTYDAKCNVNSSAMSPSAPCQGLYYDLKFAKDATADSRLIIGADALPLSVLSPPKSIDYYNPRLLPLVRVYEPTPLTGSQLQYDSIAGDPLLPHNIKTALKNFTTLPLSPLSCDARMEDRYRFLLNNHAYMEKSLQPAYTAAMFFLFQNGVKKNVIKVEDDSTTLDFAHNINEVQVWISIPSRNAIMSLVGCGVLALGLLAILVRAHRQEQSNDPLDAISSPAAVARVLLSESLFPSRLVSRRVRSGHDPKTEYDLENFRIAALTLEDDTDRRLTCEATRTTSV